jgi:hypothetical protein
MASYTAYVKLRRGGYQEVTGYDSFTYADQDVYSGWYRDTGWVPLQLPEYAWVPYPDPPTTSYLNRPIMAPATGTSATPDEQAGVDPRLLTWKETRLSFLDASANVIAQFWVSQIIGWSDTAPNTE